MNNSTSHQILITGASSGIGSHLTHDLAERGHQILATARTDDDLDLLSQIENVTPIQLDVRDPEQIQAAYNLINSQGKRLYGLVNNAGIGGLGLLSTWTDQEIFDIFDINVFGPHRMTNAFINMLVNNKGRIVNIGSQGGMITTKYFGPYTMTKFALEAYTDALYQELLTYGVHVSIVQPGGIITKVGQNGMPGTLSRFKRAEEPFLEEASLVLESLIQPGEPTKGSAADEPESQTNRKPSSPEIVSQAVYHALFSDKPKKRYLVGTKWEGDRVINGLISKLLDENDNPRHNYSRDQLIEILDMHLDQKAGGV